MSRSDAPQRILVTGATGTVGRAVLRSLLDGGYDAVAAVRRRAGSALPAEAARVRFDFTEPSTYAPALAGAGGLFLMRPPALSDAKRYVNPVVDAAEAAGVRHVTFLSVLGAGQNPLLPHRATERRLERSPLDYTLLRAADFMQNFAEQHARDIRERGEVFVPAGNGRVGFVDARDVAAAASVTLTEPGHARRAYDLTGPEALSFYEVASRLSEATERSIRYARPGALRFAWRKLRAGHPAGFVFVMVGIYTIARLGLADRVAGDLERVLGRPATNFRTFARDYADAW